MKGHVLLGYEVGTGNAVEIPLRHLAVTGQTQEAGKTTTLEALISRSGLRAVTFIQIAANLSAYRATPDQVEEVYQGVIYAVATEEP